jgi:metal-dependent amidase/aminoacylase/carboxypeptidase family protein
MQSHSLPGRIIVFGSPAEEGGGGKIALLKAGAYRDYKCDINLISHPGIVINCALMSTSAYTRFKVVYHGREAHAAAAPWMGINALDALVTAYNAVSVLRQQTMPGDIIQGYFTEGGTAPNIIHARASGVFVVRANTQARLKELRKKVNACFEAGALATGAKLVVTEEQAYADHVPNRALGRSYTWYFNRLDPDPPIAEDQDKDAINGRTGASTDQGDISYAMPSLSAGFAIPPGPLGTGPHNPEFAESAGTREAFDRAMRVGKGLAGTAMDVLTQKGLLEEVKKEWRETMKGKK